jgi:hypothetical protein
MIAIRIGMMILSALALLALLLMGVGLYWWVMPY